MNTPDKVVLVVEDNAISMRLYQALLEGHGYTMLQATNGMEGLQMAREHRPDLILMDMQLPKISGLEVTKQLKEDEILKSIPVIAVTAGTMKGNEEMYRDGGCDDYIPKPISTSDFLQTVERFLDQPVRRGALALEKVLEKEIAPNVSAKLKAIEKERAAYKKAGEKELARLTKSDDRELASLRKAKARVEKKAKKAKPTAKRPARAKAKSVAKPAARKTAAKKATAPKRAKPAAKKAVKSRAKATARKAPAKAAARKAPARKATSKLARAVKKPATKRSAKP